MSDSAESEGIMNLNMSVEVEGKEDSLEDVLGSKKNDVDGGETVVAEGIENSVNENVNTLPTSSEDRRKKVVDPSEFDDGDDDDSEQEFGQNQESNQMISSGAFQEMHL